MVSTGRGAERGVLIKRGEALERTGRIDVVVFDKTGTITEGRPSVRSVRLASSGDPDLDQSRLLQLAASVERLSEHPLAEAIAAEATRLGVSLEDVAEFESLTGKGVLGMVGGRRVAVGNAALMQELGVDPATTAFCRGSARVRSADDGLRGGGRQGGWLDRGGRPDQAHQPGGDHPATAPRDWKSSSSRATIAAPP